MRLGCLPLLIAIALLWGGGQATYTGLTNLKLKELTIEEFYQDIPDQKWLKITGGRLNILGSAYSSFLGADPNELYIPIIPEQDDEQDLPVRLILKTDNRAYLDTFLKLKKAGDDESKTEEEHLAMMIEMSEELFPQKDISGLVQFGIDADSDIEDVKKLFENIHEDCVVIEQGEKPSLFFGILLLAGGIILSAFLLIGTKPRKVPPLPQVPQST